MENVFYHGGALSDFSIDKIDIYRISTKQNHKNRTYAGFYMFDEQKRDKAFHYADQMNKSLKVQDRGVIKIVLEDDFKIYTLEGIGSIDRITVEELKKYFDFGYDLLSGKSFDGVQYILLNKDKIKYIEFEDMQMRYKEENEFKENLKNSVNKESKYTKVCKKEESKEKELNEIEIYK